MIRNTFSEKKPRFKHRVGHHQEFDSLKTLNLLLKIIVFEINKLASMSSSTGIKALFFIKNNELMDMLNWKH